LTEQPIVTKSTLDRLKELKPVMESWAKVYTERRRAAMAAQAVVGYKTKGMPPEVGGATEEQLAAAKRIFEATRTPMERYEVEIDKLNELLEVGAIDWEIYGRAVRQAKEALEGATKEIDEAAMKMEAFAQQIYYATRTPLEQFEIQIKKLTDAFKAGAFEKFGGRETFERGLKQAKEKLLGRPAEVGPAIGKAGFMQATSLIDVGALGMGTGGANTSLQKQDVQIGLETEANRILNKILEKVDVEVE